MPVTPVFTVHRVIRRVEKFDWTSEDGTCSIQFDVSRILQAIEKGSIQFQTVETPVDRQFVETWVRQRVDDMDRVINMPDQILKLPVLGCMMPDGEVLLIDGAHRYLAHYLRGRETIQHHLLEEKAWRPFAVIKGSL